MSNMIPLEQIRIASPCHADWNAMQGDDRARYCGDCRKHVYNLSAMCREEAEALIREREGNLCVRYFQRRDGTILTTDCPVGVRVRRRRAMLQAGAVVSILVSFSGVAADATTKTADQEGTGRVVSRARQDAGRRGFVRKMGAIKTQHSAHVVGKPVRPLKIKQKNVVSHPSSSNVPPPQAFMGAPALSMRDMYRYFGQPPAERPDAAPTSPQPPMGAPTVPPGIEQKPEQTPVRKADQQVPPLLGKLAAPPPANGAPVGFGVRGFLGGISLRDLQQPAPSQPQAPQQPAAPHQEPV